MTNKFERFIETMPCSTNMVLQFTGAARRRKAQRHKAGLHKVLVKRDILHEFELGVWHTSTTSWVLIRCNH